MLYNQIKQKNDILKMSCPICYETIAEEKNRVITECGHCFHTSCLMKHAAMNGFGCPYCREQMSDYVSPQSEEIDDDRIPYLLRLEDLSEEELDTAMNRAPSQVQMEDREVLDFPVSYTMPTPTFMSRKVQECGITMEDVIRLMMNEITERRDERIDGPLERKLYDRMREVIQEYNH